MWNLGAEWAIEDSGQRRGVNVAFLNNDLDLGERFLERLARALRSDPNVAAVSGNYDGRPAGGKVYERTQDICADRYDGSGGFAGFAFMVKAEFIGSGYRFPEECKWWFGDNDLLLAAEYAGGHVGIALEAEVVHLDGGAGTAGDAQWSAFREQTDRDQAAFEARWARLLAARDDRPREDESELEAAYRVLCRRPSDIYEHLPALVDVATRAGAQRIIELGVRTGVSTVAWLTALERLGSGELWSVDTGPAPFEVPGWNFVQGDDLDPAVLRRLPGEADVVFVDTDHRYGLTRDEIRAYARRVRPGGAMVFHDTNVETFDHHAPGTEPPYPVHKAVCEAFDPPGGGETAFEVAKVERHDNCNGLTIVWRAEEAPVPARLPAPVADDEALVPA
jgi:predicted O-methyltransferase YrrM